MKWTVGIIYGSAVINLCTSSLVMGLIGWGWGEEWLGERLGEIVLALFVSSVALLVTLVRVLMKIAKENRVIKEFRARKAEKLALERSFLKEAVERELEKLEVTEMKQFILDYVLDTQEMIHRSTELGKKSIALWEKTQGVIDALSDHPESRDNQSKK